MAELERCEYAYRINGAPTVHCTALKGKDAYSLCGHQYFCGKSHRYELTKEARDCRIAIKIPMWKI